MNQYRVKFKDSIHTAKELEDNGYTLKNNMIVSARIEIIAHFNNTVALEIRGENINIYSLNFNTSNIGYMIRAFIMIIGAEKEDGVYLDEIVNYPVRLVFDKDNRCIGFGHFMKDRFILTEDFSNID